MSAEFAQGDIIWFKFPNENPQPQHTIRGWHPALILHDDTMPNQTIILCPLSSLVDENGIEKQLKSYHLRLNKKDYPNLEQDSYAKLDQIMTFSRNKVQRSPIGHLNDIDKASLHLKLIETLQMQDTIKEFVMKQIEKTVKDVLDEYVESMMNDV